MQEAHTATRKVVPSGGLWDKSPASCCSRQALPMPAGPGMTAPAAPVLPCLHAHPLQAHNLHISWACLPQCMQPCTLHTWQQAWQPPEALLICCCMQLESGQLLVCGSCSACACLEGLKWPEMPEMATWGHGRPWDSRWPPCTMLLPALACASSGLHGHVSGHNSTQGLLHGSKV